jgi:hypothetical protein
VHSMDVKRIITIDTDLQTERQAYLDVLNAANDPDTLIERSQLAWLIHRTNTRLHKLTESLPILHEQEYITKN